VGDQSQKWLGKTWNGTPADIQGLRNEFEKAVAFSKRNKAPIYVGEFGAYNKADLASRVRWTKAITQLSKEYGFSTAYWEFKSGFGIYDAGTGLWNEELKAALVP
jgi:endoglucanase